MGEDAGVATKVAAEKGIPDEVIGAAADTPPRATAFSDDSSSSWVKPTDKGPEFPFFKQRREPWFWFNNVCFLIAFGAFLYFTVTIVQDFIKNQNDPPTATNFNNGLQQLFPGMAFCLHQAVDVEQPDLEPSFAFYDTGIDEIDITSQLKPVTCPLKQSTTNSIPSCWYLDGNFSAFEYSSPTTCVHRNSITMGLNFNSSDYSSEVMLIGVDGYLFLSGKSAQIFDAACKDMFPPSCSSLAPIDEECSPGQTDLSLEVFFATNRLSNLIFLSRSEVQSAPRCDQYKVRWRPQTIVSNYNPNFFAKINLTEADAENTVLLHFQFVTSDIVKTTYNPQSGPSMFGSLSGWFGFLSDGWGILSLLFICEELTNYLRATIGQ